MKAKFVTCLIVFLCSQASELLACSTCFGNYPAEYGGPPPSSQHIAMAIWVLLAAVMSVLGGVGAFSFHLWRHAHTPLEPHEELVEEDFEQYE